MRDASAQFEVYHYAWRLGVGAYGMDAVQLAGRLARGLFKTGSQPSVQVRARRDDCDEWRVRLHTVIQLCCTSVYKSTSSSSAPRI